MSTQKNQLVMQGKTKKAIPCCLFLHWFDIYGLFRMCRLFRAQACKLAYNEAGEGFIDVLVKMLIVVVVGAVLLAIMRQAIPQVFTDMLTKIRDVFEL